MKKIFNIIFTISLMSLILVITLRISIVENISKNLTKKDVSEYIINFIQKEIPNLDSLTLDRISNKLSNDSELDEMSNYILNMLIHDIKNETKSEVYLEDKVEKLINKNINLVPIQYRELINSIINSIDFNKMYSDLLEMMRYKFGGDLIKYVKIYDTITSDSVISLLITIIILSVFVIAWKNKSLTYFLNDIGISLLIDGAIMMIFLFISKRLLSLLAALFSVKIDLNTFMLLSFIFLVLGFILIDIDLKKEKKR